jgi:nicotinamidase-related amidase
MPGFPLDRSALHIAIDMQRLFAEPTEWFLPWLDRVLPNVVAIAGHAPDRTLCTRFIPPEVPEQMTGAWQDYYRPWRAMTRDTLDPRLLELAEPLARLCPPARILDKAVYSAFADPRLAPALRRKGIGTLIVTGGETDVCVLSTVMAAADLGFRVVLPVDALCSARDTIPRCPDDPLSRTLHQSGGNDIDGTGSTGLGLLTTPAPRRRRGR